MKVDDYGVVESSHWQSAADVQEYIDQQGIASMLAFDGDRCLGQLYLKEYDKHFRDPGGWFGERPWADLRLAEPLSLEGRFLTLGCYHVGWMPDNSRDTSLYGQGIGTALLKAVIAWYGDQQSMNGLLTWALPAGSKKLLVAAGQMPYTVYQRFGFQEIKQVDPGWDHEPGIGKPVLKVMLLKMRRPGT